MRFLLVAGKKYCKEYYFCPWKNPEDLDMLSVISLLKETSLPK